MASLNPFLIAAIALIPPFACAVLVASYGPVSRRVVAVQFGTTMTVFLLMLLSLAMRQPSFLDLPLTMVLISYPGTMIYTHFLERWL